jgi:hypothetical protein
MYVCIYCVFCRYANHELCKLVSLQLTMGMKATATDYAYTIYIWQRFFFWRGMDKTDIWHDFAYACA